MKKKIIAIVSVLVFVYASLSVIKSCFVSMGMSDVVDRNGLTVVEFTRNTILYDDPDTMVNLEKSCWGMNQHGSRIAYSRDKYEPGKVIYSFFVYNPFNNSPDDIIFRFDIDAKEQSI